MKKKKILFYNWIQFDNQNNIGGGVNVYQRNIIERMINENVDIYFLSAGWEYNSLKFGTYLTQTENIFGPKCKTFTIINSPIMAPAFYTHKNLKTYLEDTKTYRMLRKFIEKHGPFDVIHINNIEGISINVLKLKKIYPNTKFVLSIHNYQPICPLVQYFDNQKKCICADFEAGNNCINCSVRKLDKKELFYRTREYLQKTFTTSKNKNIFPILNIFNKLISSLSYRKYYGASRLKKSQIFEKYRKTNIQIINDNIDVVLAVSNRVRDIMIEHGINKDKIFTSYIGTKFAENEKRESVAPKNTIFTLACLGFEKVDKGYFFMIDALSKLPIEYQKKINIVLAVANFNPNNIKGKLDNFNDVKIFKGYNHNELGNILQNVHLGLVPVLWEDNLPQVAIEMVACGVPILCSSFGGASELCKDELFKFEGGNTNKMLQKIMQFVDNKQLLDLYWNQHPPLTTMTNHIQELFKFYGGETNA